MVRSSARYGVGFKVRQEDKYFMNEHLNDKEKTRLTLGHIKRLEPGLGQWHRRGGFLRGTHSGPQAFFCVKKIKGWAREVPKPIRFPHLSLTPRRVP